MKFIHFLLIYVLSIILTISIITLSALEQSNFANLKTYSYSQGKFLEHSFDLNIDPVERKAGRCHFPVLIYERAALIMSANTPAAVTSAPAPAPFTTSGCSA